MAIERTKSIKIRVTEAEHQALKDRCTKSELAPWMREVCLGENVNPKVTVPKCDPYLLRQLAGIGNNINQIARVVNQKNQSFDTVQILVELASIQRQLDELKP